MYIYEPDTDTQRQPSHTLTHTHHTHIHRYTDHRHTDTHTERGTNLFKYIRERHVGSVIFYQSHLRRDGHDTRHSELEVATTALLEVNVNPLFLNTQYNIHITYMHMIYNIEHNLVLLIV